MDCPRTRSDVLDIADAAEAELRERGLQVLDQQVDKVVQLHEVRSHSSLSMASAHNSMKMCGRFRQIRTQMSGGMLALQSSWCHEGHQ